jgi:hypothetical protein
MALLTHLLGKEIIDDEAYRWGTAPFTTPLECHGYQLEWTQYILMREEATLSSPGRFAISCCPVLQHTPSNLLYSL